jgi:regulation of enolase protein 1 (concanavalin A-like superfamily)
MTIRNDPELAEVAHGNTLRLAAKNGTNLFNSPEGNYCVQTAPMALIEPDENFVLTAKVSAALKNIYDFAALVIYQAIKSRPAATRSAAVEFSSSLLAIFDSYGDLHP